MRPSTVALLFILACTLFAAWFFNTHEKVVKTQFTGYHGEARVNDFLAADLLLNELGIDADSRPSLTPSNWLPEPSDTVVSRLSESFSIGIQRELLMAWVSEGGHLVALPPRQPSRTINDMLEALGFQLIEIDSDDNSDSEDESSDDSDEASVDYVVDLDGTRFRITALPQGLLSATLSDDIGIVAARREWGEGYVTVVANSEYFDNRSIGSFDHGRLLLDTVAGYIPSGTVWFIYDSTFPSLWQVIWGKASYVVIGLAATLLLWLWSIIPKFGPAISSNPPERRSIMEHIQAAGHFMWRNRGGETLTASSISATMHEVERRHPGVGRLSMQEKANLVARITGLSAQAILHALSAEGELRHRDFTNSMQVLQKIRKEL